MKRRDFIRISALGAGGVAISSSMLGWLYAETIDNNIPKPIAGSKFPTYCEICFWKCAGWVHTDENNEIWKITGNADDPHCNGRLCPRGTGGIGMYNDEDRLKTPLIRVENNGKQEFREASWDEALTYIAEKMKTIESKYGPNAMALFAHGSSTSYFSHLIKAFGSDNIGQPSYAQCRGPREAAFISTFGEPILSPERTDIRDTRCLVLIGSHIGENMHNAQVQEMSDAIDRGATIITVDPRYSTAASKSKFWLPIKPATDLALLLAWIHEIIYNEYYDKKYVEKYTSGFDQLKEHVKSFTPEWAYGITTIEPHLIRETARQMADASPAVIVHPGRHVTWYGDDTQRMRAVAILNALLGSWGRRGGFFSPEKFKLKKMPVPHYPEFKKSWREAYPGKFNLADEEVTNAILDLTFPSKDRDWSLKGWIVTGTNLIHTIPNQKHTLEAIKNLDLLVVVDTMPMEMTGYADVVLPECTYLERYDDIRVSPTREPSIALRMPAAEPKYNTKPAWWIAKTLAGKLGLGDYFPYENIEEKLDYELKQSGTSLDEMKKIGVKVMSRQADDLYFADEEDVEFSTNTGKIELYSTALEAEGFDPLPKYTAHPEPQAGYYRLIYGRAPMHTFSRTSNNPNLVDLMEENAVWINPKVANQWGLSNGQYVWLENQDGVVSKNRIKVRITERIRWDSVYMVHGFGHTDSRLSRANGKGVSDSELITNVMYDQVMGGTGMRGNFVTFKTSLES